MEEIKTYGLVGFPLGHSFSKSIFEEKFLDLKIEDAHYELLELKSIDQLENLLDKTPGLVGFNVTIPYKEQIMKSLSSIDPVAAHIGAINVVKIEMDGSLTGYNTDYLAFRQSLQSFIPGFDNISALVLGSGGSSKAVVYALDQLDIPHVIVSRNPGTDVQYQHMENDPELLVDNKLIVNTTPLGMSPKINQYADININYISSSHYIFDLIYNPEKTLLLKMCEEKGARIKNGMEMLYLQAEESWKIWNK
jgi:shikimate dehydrogenase